MTTPLANLLVKHQSMKTPDLDEYDEEAKSFACSNS